MIIIINNMDHKVYEINKEKEYNNSFLTLMIETEADSGIYEKSNSSLWPGDGYIFNEQMSSCENGGELSWNEELNTINLKTNTAAKCYVYFDIYSPPTLADYIINNIYVDDGVNNLYFHDGIGTHANANLESGDNSYRYSGANPNNYVCFGSNAAICPNDNLYRIIGVFGNEVKLIKNTSIGNYYWSGSSSNQSNIWSNSTLNTSTLNGAYLAGLDNNSWSNMIATHTWKVGGMSYTYGYSTPQTAYNYETGANSSSTTYNAKIGLMYVSDYGFAASNTYWSTNLNSYNGTTSNNWLYLGSNEWTISRRSDNSDFAFRVYSGTVGNSYVYNSSNAVRPVFYLNSNVVHSSGFGTISDPIRIN